MINEERYIKGKEPRENHSPGGEPAKASRVMATPEGNTEEEVVNPASGTHDSDNTAFAKLWEEIECMTHYERVCHKCGRQWGSLHCIHDGVQGTCPDCGERGFHINTGDCNCEFTVKVKEIEDLLKPSDNQESCANDSKSIRISKKSIISPEGKLLMQMSIDRVLVLPKARVGQFKFPGIPIELNCHEANELLEIEESVDE